MPVQYGGFYGPTFFSYFEDQNKLIKKGKHAVAKAKQLNMATLGLLDACIDSKVMAESFPQAAYNNTYGIEVYSEKVFKEAMAAIAAPEEGCHALIDNCRAIAKEGDPKSFGYNETVNNACLAATDVCFNKVQGAFSAYSNVGNDSISHLLLQLLTFSPEIPVRRHCCQPHAAPPCLPSRLLQPTLGSRRPWCAAQFYIKQRGRGRGFLRCDW